MKMIERAKIEELKDTMFLYVSWRKHNKLTVICKMKPNCKCSRYATSFTIWKASWILSS